MTSPSSRHAHVVGLGLIGGSLALALREIGFAVTGEDRSEECVAMAIERGVISDSTAHAATELIVVATPAETVVNVVRDCLATNDSPTLVVTDVAGIKGSIGRVVDDPRYIGGHPMAGSEQRGLDGARSDLFRGCTWVLTPTAATDAARFSWLHGVLRELGANVMALDFETHDRLVAIASHVPHLVAGALMNEASVVAASDGALLQLAAGGFRDMTRVSAGDPAIWPGVLIENAEAVTAGLRSLRTRLQRLEEMIASEDRGDLVDELTEAAVARRALPGRGVHSEELTHLRVPVPDRPGVLAQVTTTASDLNVNIYDIEIAHSVEGQPGVIIIAIERALADRLAQALADLGYRVAREEGR
jgi:prephenate dehydrogenase